MAQDDSEAVLRATVAKVLMDEYPSEFPDLRSAVPKATLIARAVRQRGFVLLGHGASKEPFRV